MTWAIRIPGWLTCAVAVGGYIALALPLAIWFAPEQTPFEAALKICIPAPVFLFVAGWLHIELKLGRHLIPRLKPDAEFRTVGQARAELRAVAVLVPLIAFLCLAPVMSAALSGNAPGMTAFASLFVWGWIIYANGFSRIRIGGIMLLNSASSSELNTDSVRRVATGLALELKVQNVDRWNIQVTVRVDEGVPRLVVTAKATLTQPTQGTTLQPVAPTPDKEFTIGQRREDQIALLASATPDGNPYRLYFASSLNLEFTPQSLSTHETMAAFQSLKDARDQVPQLLARK